MVPYAAAGPLSGTVAPIRIASFVTPTSLAVPPPACAAGAVAAAGAPGAVVAAGAPPLGAVPLEHAASARLVRPSRAIRKRTDLTVGDSFRFQSADSSVDVGQQPHHAAPRQTQDDQQQDALYRAWRGVREIFADG